MIEPHLLDGDVPAMPPESTYVDLLRRRAVEQPDRRIYFLLEDEFFAGGPPGPSLSYGELDVQARAIAVRLQTCCRLGDRVLLLFAPGLEFIPAFFGCLYAGVVPVPAYPPYRSLQADPLAALRRLVENCQPRAILTGGWIGASVEAMCRADETLASLHWFQTEAVPVELAANWSRPDVDHRTTALLQYTSGSTGSPRGVIVAHDQLLKNEYIIQLAFNHMTHRKQGVGVCWLPFHHDLGLMGSVLQSIFVDGVCYFMSPLQFLRKPVRWLQAMTRFVPENAYISGGPNFAYELCVNKVTEAEKRDLDLSTWTIAGIMAEPISPATVRRFTEAFAPCGFRPEAFYPAYGLAEATLFVTGGDYDAEPMVRTFVERNGVMEIVADEALQEESVGEERPPEKVGSSLATGGQRRTLVSCGRPWLGHEVVIVDPQTRVQRPDRCVGEIWVGGPCVADGYWNQPEETERTFHARLADDERGPFLRTGDLGFVDRGELFISGRLKDLIIIRGRNYHPQDIEDVVSQMHEAFRPSSTAAFGCEKNGQERLVILQEIDRQSRRLDTKVLAADVRQRVAEELELYADDVVFLRNGSLPKTTSGKIRRSEARSLYEQGQLAEWKSTRPKPE